MSQRSPGTDPSTGPASEALAKVLAELQGLTPGTMDPNQPAFPPRLVRADRPPVRPKKIELEFQAERPSRGWPLKAAAASAALFAIGAVAMNIGYPMLKAPFSASRLAMAEPEASSPAAAAPEEPLPTGGASGVRLATLASAGKEGPVSVVQEPPEEGNITTGAMPNAVVAAKPGPSAPALQFPQPTRPLELPPLTTPAVPASSDSAVGLTLREERPHPTASLRAGDAAQDSRTGVQVASVDVKPIASSSTAAAEVKPVASSSPDPAPVPEVKPVASPPPPVAAPPAEVKPIASSPRDPASTAQVEPVAPPPQPVPVANPDRLIRRAQDLIRDGDISGARLILERALSSGSAQAAFALAQTYDPEVLSQWQARGIKGDMARARQLYQVASDRGMAEAKERIASLR
jgi:hypothetical protein